MQQFCYSFIENRIFRTGVILLGFDELGFEEERKTSRFVLRIRVGELVGFHVAAVQHMRFRDGDLGVDVVAFGFRLLVSVSFLAEHTTMGNRPRTLSAGTRPRSSKGHRET
jgi:hypothetical protein